MSEEIARLRLQAEKDPTKRVRLVDMLIAHQEVKEAIALCQRWLVASPNDATLKLALGRALSAGGRLKEAQAIFRQVAEAEDGGDFDELPTNLVQPESAAKIRADMLRPPPMHIDSVTNTEDYNSLAEEESSPHLPPTGDASTIVARVRDTGQGALIETSETLDERLERLAALVHQSNGYIAPVAVVPTSADHAFAKKRMVGFAWLWVSFVLFVVATAGGYHYRTLVRRAKLAEGVAAANAAAQAGTFAGDRAARDILAGLVRAMPDEASLFADVAQANARLAADHGEDTDDAGWAMLRRAEKTFAERRVAVTPATNLTLKQTHTLLSLYRPEPCPDDIAGVAVDISARCQQIAGQGRAAQEALAKAPATDLRAQMQLGVAYYGEGDSADATRIFDQLVKVSPHQEKAKLLAWIIRLEKGDMSDFGPLPPGGLSNDEEGWLYLGRALQATTASDVDEALAEVQQRMLHDGRLALAVGRVRLGRGQLGQAEQAMRLAEKLEPNDPDVAVLDAEVALAKGYEQKVSTALGTTQNSPRQQVVFGKALLLAGHPKEALQQLNAALQKRPTDVAALTYRALARARSGDVVGGERELGQLKKDPLVHFGLGYLAFNRKDYKRAIDEFAFVTNSDEAFRARSLKGLAEAELGQLDKAIVDLEEVRKAAPEFRGVHSALGRIYLSLGRDREARGVIAYLIEDPRGLAMDADRMRYTEATARRGLTTEAAQLIEALPPTILPPERDRLRALVQSFRGGKEALAAAARLEKIKKSPGAHERLLVDIADAYRRGGDFKRGLPAARAAIVAQPFWGQVALGKSLAASNDPAGAEAAYRAALTAVTAKPYGVDAATEVHEALAQLALSRGDKAAAVAELKTALTDDPHAADVYVALGRVYLADNARDKAVEAFEHATLEDGEFAEAWLAYADASRDLAVKSPPDAATKLRANARKAYEHYLTLEPSVAQAKAVRRSLFALPK